MRLLTVSLWCILSVIESQLQLNIHVGQNSLQESMRRSGARKITPLHHFKCLSSFFQDDIENNRPQLVYPR